MHNSSRRDKGQLKAKSSRCRFVCALYIILQWFDAICWVAGRASRNSLIRLKIEWKFSYVGLRGKCVLQWWMRFHMESLNVNQLQCLILWDFLCLFAVVVAVCAVK